MFLKGWKGTFVFFCVVLTLWLYFYLLAIVEYLLNHDQMAIVDVDAFLGGLADELPAVKREPTRGS